MAVAAQSVPTGLPGEYSLRVKFANDDDLVLDPRGIRELSITHDLNRTLPSFRLKTEDGTGILSHFTSVDVTRTITIEIGSKSGELDPFVSYTFDDYRKFPNSNDIYDIEGLLSVPNVFSPSFCRSFSSPKAAIEQVGADMGMDEVVVSSSLDYDRNIVQPDWSNATFLNYLSSTVVGASQEAGYYYFIRKEDQKLKLFFKHLGELVHSPVKYNFVVGSAFETKTKKGDTVQYYPVWNYRVEENHLTVGIKGLTKRGYTYFDYDTGTFKYNEVNLDSFPSCAEAFLISKDDDAGRFLDVDTGQTSAYTSDFVGQVKGTHYKRTNKLVRMWITSFGLGDLHSGDTILLKWTIGVLPNSEMEYQYQGYWMVEKVIHRFGMTWISEILLCRNGVDVGDLNTSLEVASRVQRKKV